MNTVTIFLGLSVGSKLSADKFLNFETLDSRAGTVCLPCTAGGLWLGRLMCKLSGGKINPMIGAAGVSAVRWQPVSLTPSDSKPIRRTSC